MPFEPVPWRLQGSIYGAAFFFGPLQSIATMAAALFVAGLVGVELPLLIGFILASRQLLTVCLSVYGGALMDNFGSRRVIIAFGLLGATSAMAYPLIPGLFGVAWGAGLLVFALSAMKLGLHKGIDQRGDAEGGT